MTFHVDVNIVKSRWILHEAVGEYTGRHALFISTNPQQEV